MRRGFEMYAAGMSYSQILADTHVYTVKSNLVKALRSEVYIGYLTGGGERCENLAPPLVDVDVWHAVQKRLQKESALCAEKNSAW